jgi:hypothetical protein
MPGPSWAGPRGLDHLDRSRRRGLRRRGHDLREEPGAKVSVADPHTTTVAIAMSHQPAGPVGAPESPDASLSDLSSGPDGKQVLILRRPPVTCHRFALPVPPHTKETPQIPLVSARATRTSCGPSRSLRPLFTSGGTPGSRDARLRRWPRTAVRPRRWRLSRETMAGAACAHALRYRRPISPERRSPIAKRTDLPSATRASMNSRSASLTSPEDPTQPSCTSSTN